MKFNDLIQKAMNESVWDGYDNWLQKGNPAEDEEDAPECEDCGEHMEHEVDVDIDEETGRAVSSGGSWHCTNPECCSQ